MAAKNPWSALLQSPEDRFTDDSGLEDKAPELDPKDIAPVRSRDAIANLLRAYSQRVPQQLTPDAPAARPPASPAQRGPSSGAQQALLDQLNAPMSSSSAPPRVPAQQDLLNQLNRGPGRGLLPPPKPPVDTATPSARANTGVVASELARPGQPTPAIDAATPPAPMPDPAMQAGKLSSELPLSLPRSGQKTSAEQSAEQGSKGSTERASFMGGDQMKALSDQFMTLPFVKQQMQDAQDRRELMRIAAMNNSPQVDLSPLAALADSWVNSSKGQKPQSDITQAVESGAKNRQNGMEALLKLGSQNSTDNQNMTKDMLSSFTALKNGKDLSDVYSKYGTKADASNQDPVMRVNPLMALQAGIHLTERNMNTQKDQEETQELTHLQGMLRDGTAITDRNFPLLIAKTVAGSGRIAAYEVAREAGNPAILSQFDQMASTLGTGRITPENHADYVKFVDMLARNHLGYRQIQANRDRAISQRLGLTDDDANALLPGSFVNDLSPHVYPGGGSAPGKPGQVKPSTDALIQKFLEQKAGK